MTYATIDVTIL